MPHHTCRHCRKWLVLRPPVNVRTKAELETVVVSKIPQSGIVDAIQDSCALFLYLIHPYLHAGGIAEQSIPSNPEIHQRWFLAQFNTGSDDQVVLTLQSGGNPVQFHNFRAFQAGASFKPCFEHRANEQEFIPQVNRVRPINWSPNSPESYRLARSWIDECLTKHNHETSTLTASHFNSLPLRLLYIQNIAAKYETKLVSTHDNRNKDYDFVALSYCWGGDQPHKTTKMRLRETKGKIDYSQLPATIQDAIQVTSGLGFHYLWVDSLCIVQDDPDELIHEIAKMASIYNQAVVTISAVSAAAAADGFLNRRTFQGALYISDINLETPDGTIHKVGISANDNPRFRSVDLKSSRTTPLFLEDRLGTRAWVSDEVVHEKNVLTLSSKEFQQSVPEYPKLRSHYPGALQEFVLSKRILQYINYQTRFLCPKYDLFGPVPSPSDGWKVHASSEVRVPLLNTGHLEDDFEEFWHKIVHYYTMRDLTLAKDRPVAISGVADAINRLKGHRDVYIAGHWRTLLPDDLLWGDWNMTLGPGVNRAQAMYERPKDFQAPSWSWTSVNGHVSWNAYEKNPPLVWELLNYSVTLINELAPFGTVRGAELYMRASVIDIVAKIDIATGKPCPPTNNATEMVGECLELWADYLPSPEENQPTQFALALARGRTSYFGTTFGTAWGLILQEVQACSEMTKTPRYRRWGIFRSIKTADDGIDDWFKSWTCKEFRLI